MKDKYQNKMVGEEKEATKAENLKVYDFPEHGVSFRAGSLDEAYELLNKYLKDHKTEVKNG